MILLLITVSLGKQFGKIFTGLSCLMRSCHSSQMVTKPGTVGDGTAGD